MTKTNGRKAPATRGAKSTMSNGKSATVNRGRTNVNKRSPVIKKESEDKDAVASGSESDVPIGERLGAASNGKRVTRSNGQTRDVTIKKEEPIDSEDQPTRRKPKKIIPSDSEESESDVPISKRVKDTKPAAKGKQSKGSASSSKQTIAVKKEEPVVDGKKAKRKRAESDSEGDDSTKATQKKTMKTEPTKIDTDAKMKDAELESENVPIVKKLGKANGKKPVVKEEPSDYESDVPLGKRVNKGKQSTSPNKRTTRATTANVQVKQENKAQKTNDAKSKRKRNDSDSEFDDKKKTRQIYC